MNMIVLHDAHSFLAAHFGADIADVALIGEGAWSRCFAFRRHEQELVVRFGNHADDFFKDQRAQAYAAPGLPVPEVLEIGAAFGGFYAISTRVHGMPLERLDAAEWLRVIPAIVDVLEALRRTQIPAELGAGSWGPDGRAVHNSWRAYLLEIGNDTPERRIYGWRKQLEHSPEGVAAFEWGFALLQQLARDDVPRSLVHCDLMNRNVLVEGDRITGVFDWGCALYGDHLYELAWFEFWAPWHTCLDTPALRAALEQRWEEAGYTPEHKDERLTTCYLHIGLDHLAYNAYLGDWEALAATAARMRELCSD